MEREKPFESETPLPKGEIPDDLPEQEQIDHLGERLRQAKPQPMSEEELARRLKEIKRQVGEPEKDPEE